MMTDVNWHRDRVARTGNLLLILTWATLLVLLVEMGLNASQYQLISDAISDNFSSATELVERATQNYNYRMIEGIVRLVLEIAAGITFLVWVHRSDALARALGSDQMAHSTAWSVIWFFVPFANLVKPYFVLKEIYVGTVVPRTYNLRLDQPAGLHMLVLWWWATIAEALFLAAAPLLTDGSRGLQGELTATHILAGSGVLSIASTILMLLVVMDFEREQQTAAPALPGTARGLAAA
jgi:hypothetical protein